MSTSPLRALRVRRLAAAAALALATLAAPAQADALLDRARTLLEQRDAAGAYALLEPQENRRAGDPGFDYLLGIAALDAGHVSRAIFALERVLAERPQDNLARAEIARAYLAAGEREAARSQFEQARRGPMPEAAAATIDRVLGALAEGERGAAQAQPRWSAYAEATAGHDSNVNSTTATATFALPAFSGALVTLDPAYLRRGSAFATVGAGAEGLWPLAGPWSGHAAVNARHTATAHAHELAPATADASAGVAWRQGSHQASLSLQTASLWLDGSAYRNASGLSGQWQHALSPQSQATLFVQWSDVHYPGQPVRDAERLLLGSGAARAFDGGARVLYASVYAVDERSRTGTPEFGHHGLGLRLGGELRWGERTTGFATVQFERRHYGGSDPYFNVARHDRQADLQLGVHLAAAGGWRLTPQLMVTRNASNVVPSDYRRLLWQLTLRKEWNS